MATPRRSKRPVRPIARLIGARIKTLREARELTQEKLAWEAGLSSKGYLSRIEDGQRLPSVDVLEKLSRRLDVEARDLLIFPARSPVDEAMELLRLGGTELATRVLTGIAVEPTDDAKPAARKGSRQLPTWEPQPVWANDRTQQWQPTVVAREPRKRKPK